MNKYYLLSKEYFQEIEGWYLYRQSGRHWLSAWVCLSLLWAALFIPLVTTAHKGYSFFLWMIPLVAVEIIVLSINSKIQSNKRKFLIENFNEKYYLKANDDIECREFLLTRLLNKAPSTFLAAAKEISELETLNRSFQRLDSINAKSIFRKIYDPDSKARVFAGILATITVCTALIARSLADDFNIIESIMDPSWGRFMLLILMTSVAAYIMLIGSQELIKLIWYAAILWATKLLSTKESTVTLHYFARDLIKFHQPAKDSSTGC